MTNERIEQLRAAVAGDTLELLDELIARAAVIEEENRQLRKRFVDPHPNGYQEER